MSTLDATCVQNMHVVHAETPVNRELQDKSKMAAFSDCYVHHAGWNGYTTHEFDREFRPRPQHISAVKPQKGNT